MRQKNQIELNHPSRALRGSRIARARRLTVTCSTLPSGAVIDNGLPWLAIAFEAWATIVFMLMLGRIQRFGFLQTVLAYFLNSVFLALLIASVQLPVFAIVPILLVGDYVFVSKYTYGYGRFSLPFSPPLFSGRIFRVRRRRIARQPPCGRSRSEGRCGEDDISPVVIAARQPLRHLAA